MAVPIALLRQLVYPTTYRLPHLERLIFPAPVAAVPISPPIVTKTVSVTIPLPGNLPNDSYRFFTGVRYVDSPTSRCRWCGIYFNTDQLRKRHLHETVCRNKLDKLYQYVRKEFECIVCNARTKRQKWGIPICSIECENSWKFEFPAGWTLLKDAYEEDSEI